MTNVITPSIGRRLWLRFISKEVAAALGFHLIDERQPCDAGVTYVWNDRMVNVLATDHQGNVKALTSITLMQEGDFSRGESCWLEWMPYQSAQAKKESSDTSLEVERWKVYANTLQGSLDQAHRELAVARTVIESLSDLLSSARSIAARHGADTAWERFDERAAALGISAVTAKTFKVLPSDTE